MSNTAEFVTSGSLSSRKFSARTGRLTLAGDRSHIGMSDDVVEYVLTTYTPDRRYPEGVLAWARDLTVRSRPSGRRDARTLCRRLCDMGEHLLGAGWTFDAPVAVLLSDGNIAGYFIDNPPNKTGTADTTASQLRRVRKAVSGERRITITGGRTDVDSAVTPATDDEVSAFRRWVEGIDDSSVHHRDGFTLVALIRGAGCTKADLDKVTLDSLAIEANGDVSVAIGEPVGRIVRVSAKWAEPLARIASRGTATGALFELDGRARRGTAALKGLENRYYKQRSGLDDHAKRRVPPFLNVNTYRAAWLLDRLQDGTRLDHLLHEAGLSSAAALDRYLQYLPGSVAPRSR